MKDALSTLYLFGVYLRRLLPGYMDRLVLVPIPHDGNRPTAPLGSEIVEIAFFDSQWVVKMRHPSFKRVRQGAIIPLVKF